MSIFKSLCRYLFEPKDPLEREIYRLENAICRTENLIDDLIDSEKDQHICCYSCAFGNKYTDLVDKLERQEFHLDFLKKKINERNSVGNSKEAS